MARSYFTCTTPLMLLACKLWDLIVIGGLEQTSLVNLIFLSIAKVKARWRPILTCCLKNWMQKDRDKWSFNHLSWNIRTYSLMKQFMSCLGALCTSMAIGIKWCSSWSLLYLQILIMALTSTITLDGQLMTFVAIISHVKLVTTTLATKT
jgi:uncharacterized membrane protein